MQSPLEIKFLGMASSESVEAAIGRLADRLDHVYTRIQRCIVTVELPHRHHEHGKQFHVKIVLTVPDAEIDVSHDSADPRHEDVYNAISDAFHAARRQLLDYAQVRRGDVKHKDSNSLPS